MYGISAGKLADVIKDGIAEFDEHRIVEMPEHLGLDETEIDGALRLVAVDTTKSENHPARLIEIYPARLKEDVKEFLESMAHPERLKTVTIDMWKGYANAVAECFDTEHQVRVIVDRYHVMGKLLERVEEVRKNLCARIEERAKNDPDLKEVMKACKYSNLNHFWFRMSRKKLEKNTTSYRNFAAIIAAFPELGELYKIKEDFHDLYEYSPDRESAEAAYEAWCDSIPHSKDYAPLTGFRRTIKTWRKEFFNYFEDPLDARYSNGPVEALNRTIKNLVGDGYGYGFDVLRAKIIYGNSRFPADYLAAKRPHVPKGKPSFAQSCMDFRLGVDTPEIREDIFAVLKRDDTPDLDYIKTVTDGWSQEDIIGFLKEGNNMDAVCGAAEALDRLRESITFEPIPLDVLEKELPVLKALMDADMALGYDENDFDTEPRSEPKLQ